MKNCSGLVRKQPALQGAAAAAAAALPWQRRGEHVLESESQGYSISSCFNNIIPYERNITSLVSMMKIHIRSFQPPICPMNAKNLPSSGTQENERHASRFHLHRHQLMRPDFSLLRGLYYFWLSLFKRDRTGQSHRRVFFVK